MKHFHLFWESFSLRIRPRVLIDVSNRETKCNLFGIDMAFPVAIAPTAMQRMAHPEGELATARGKSQIFRHFDCTSFHIRFFFRLYQRPENVIQFIQ